MNQIKARVKNDTGAAMMRGGYIFPPYSECVIDVKPKRFAEIEACAALSVKMIVEQVGAPEPQAADTVSEKAGDSEPTDDKPAPVKKPQKTAGKRSGRSLRTTRDE